MAASPVSNMNGFVRRLTHKFQARTQLFRRGGVHFKLERTSCQQSLKYMSLYNTGGAPFSTKKINIFLCT